MNSNWTDKLNDKNIKAPASHLFKFLCHPTFGTPARFAGGFAKSHEPTHNQNFIKEPNYPPTSSF